MFLADTLTRAYQPGPEVNTCDFFQHLEEVDHTATLAVSPERLEQLRHASAEDAELQMLRKTILQGWPERKSDTLECVHAYFDFRDELTIQDQLLFKGPRLVVPLAMPRR